MTTDPNDPCCQVPSCTVVPTPVPVQTPSPMPGVNTVVPGTVPTPVPSAFPSPIPTGQTGTIVGQPQIPPLRGEYLYSRIFNVLPGGILKKYGKNYLLLFTVRNICNIFYK